MSNQKPIHWVVAGALLVLGCETSETKACTLIGCESGFQVNLQTAAWASGTWKVEAKVGAETRTCSVTLPLPSNGQATCSGKLTLGTSGSALAPSQQSLTGVHLSDTPTAVTLTVFRDGTLQASKDFAPTYATSQPNGAGCEPTCTQANATLSW